jgi:eukaryotic-like serine/threonine-protein kinase
VFIGSLDSKSRKRLMTLESKAIYSPPGFILFLQGQTLMARPFDANRLEFTGEAVSVADNVALDAEQRAFYVDGGTLLYRNREGRTNQHWVWTDRTGIASPLDKASLTANHVRLSPDGKRVAFIEGTNNADAKVWTYDIDRNLKTRVTTDMGSKRFPIWSPDGTRLVFGSASGSPRSWSLRETSSDGASKETTLLESEPLMGVLPDDWSRDGRYIVFEKFKDGTRGVGSSARSATTATLWILPRYGDRKPFPYLETAFDKGQAVFSPNGRWLAYVSNESGLYQVFVQPFPNASEGKWQISSAGGMAPHWKGDGRELYYLDPNGRIIAVPVRADSKFEVGTPTTLFTTTVPYPSFPTYLVYDVTPDGQHFLVSTPFSNRASSQITVVLNWPLALKR